MEFRLKTLSLQGRSQGLQEVGGSLEANIYRLLAQQEVCVLSSAICPLITATSEDEVNMWIKGLTWLMEDTLQAATPLQIER